MRVVAMWSRARFQVQVLACTPDPAYHKHWQDGLGMWNGR